MRYCISILAVTCIFLYPCDGNTVMSKYEYFYIDCTKEIDKIEYVSGGGIDTMVIEFKNEKGFLYVYCLPLEKDEFRETCKIDVKDEHLESEDIEVEIDDRIIHGKRIDYENGKCPIQCVDYREEMVFLTTYGGDAKYVSVFLDLMKSITYQIERRNVEKMKKKYLETKEYIKNLDLPRYAKSENEKISFCATTLKKRIEYEVQSTEKPRDVLNFYIKYFSELHWIAYMAADDNSVDLINGGKYYIWKNQENDVIAEFYCLSQPMAGYGSRPIYEVYIQIFPIIAGYKNPSEESRCLANGRFPIVCEN